MTVPNGSAFTEGAVPVGWYTNTTYTPEIRAALESTGYHLLPAVWIPVARPPFIVPP